MLKHLFSRYFLMALLLVSAGAHFALADNEPPTYQRLSAEVVYADGVVELQRESTGNWLAANKGEKLAGGDSLKTGEKGKAEIKFVNENVVRLGSNSLLKIQEAMESPANGHQKTRIQLGGGKLWNKITRPFKKDEDESLSYYRVETPIAVAAVKGTIFDVSFSDDASQIRVFEGTVSAANPMGTILIPANTLVTLRPSQPLPSQPEALPPNAAEEWNWGTSGSNLPGTGVGSEENTEKEKKEEDTSKSTMKTESTTPPDASLASTQITIPDIRSPLIAGLTGLIVPLVGEFYAGQYIKGIVFTLAEAGFIYGVGDSNVRATEARRLQALQYYESDIKKYKDQADLADQQSQIYTGLAVLTAVISGWDSFKEASALNEAQKQPQLSFYIKPDLSQLAMRYAVEYRF